MRRNSWTKATSGARLHYILIDYENVQPADLAGLDAESAQVFVFTGAQQKIGIALVEAVQALGERGRFVRITGNGPNALDFHIAYYLGQWMVHDPQGTYLIVSRDTGFDPLIAHLGTGGAQVKRISVDPPTKKVATKASKKAQPPVAKKTPAQPAAKVASKQPSAKKAKAVKIIVDPPLASKSAGAVSLPKPTAPSKPATTDADKVLKRLIDMPNNLPGTEASLRRMMGTWLSKDAKRLDATIAELKRRAVITLTGTKVAYQLPKG